MVLAVATVIPDGRNRRKQAERTAIERLKSADAKSESTQQTVNRSLTARLTAVETLFSTHLRTEVTTEADALSRAAETPKATQNGSN